MGGPEPRPLRARFEEKYIPEPMSGCWLWTHHVTHDGYGRMSGEAPNRKMVLSHRVSYALFRGPVSDDIKVLHQCDNPPCVNPDHLFLGTQGDNINDCVAKGRWNRPKGEKSGNAKLNEAQAAEIKHSSEKNKDLAARFGVTYGLVSQIKTGRAWKHLP